MSNEHLLTKSFSADCPFFILPEKEFRSHSPNFQIHVSVSSLYIPTIDLPILLQEVCGPILGKYKWLTDT
jgi:hypothetical protein